VLQSHFGLGGGGRLGVALFFALSGYLMGELLFVKNVALPGFFKRRFSRVVPTFWLYVAVAFALATWFGAERYQVPGDELVSTLLFARTYLPASVSIWAEQWPIGHFWSLNVEEHSYSSFSLYIWQQPFYDAYLHGHLQRQLAGVLALIVASIAFYLYEDPVRRRLNNGSRRTVSALPVQAERGIP
jgi:peptidoglycan/LPS O-acetylase OafA/YrhL